MFSDKGSMRTSVSLTNGFVENYTDGDEIFIFRLQSRRLYSQKLGRLCRDRRHS